MSGLKRKEDDTIMSNKCGDCTYWHPWITHPDGHITGYCGRAEYCGIFHDKEDDKSDDIFFGCFVKAKEENIHGQ